MEWYGVLSSVRVSRTHTLKRVILSWLA
jgi:hypothetical protein